MPRNNEQINESDFDSVFDLVNTSLFSSTYKIKELRNDTTNSNTRMKEVERSTGMKHFSTESIPQNADFIGLSSNSRNVFKSHLETQTLSRSIFQKLQQCTENERKHIV